MDINWSASYAEKELEKILYQVIKLRNVLHDQVVTVSSVSSFNN